jgi:hypothetical protein
MVVMVVVTAAGMVGEERTRVVDTVVDIHRRGDIPDSLRRAATPA